MSINVLIVNSTQTGLKSYNAGVELSLATLPSFTATILKLLVYDAQTLPLLVLLSQDMF